jgi:hypothetical protein
MPKPRRSKYGNVKTTVQGFEFDSKKEASRFLQLQSMQRRGEISALEIQVRYELSITGYDGSTYKIADYIADFVYDLPDGTPVVEDVKGVLTAVYRLKRRLMLAIYGAEILET